MTFIRNYWYVASWAHELSPTHPTAITIIGEPLVLFRTAAGDAAALEDCCCHRSAPLSHGRCESGLLRCMYHGLLFDGTGKCVRIPGQAHIPAACRVRSYPTVESRGLIWVWMGDPTLADTRQIPVPDDYDPTDWDMRSSQCDVQANYLLMTDNLADMSHVAYLHETTLAGGDTRISDSHPTITRLERGIRVERWLADRRKMEDWLPDDPRLPPASPSERRQDLWLGYDLLAPGIFVMRSEIHEAGVAHASGYAAPQKQPLHANLNFQAVTPAGQTSMRHFFALGPPRRETVGNPTLAHDMFEVMLKSFAEDRIMLEAQQRNLARRPIQAAAAIRHDHGLQLMRRIIRQMIEQESDSLPSQRPAPDREPVHERTSSPLE